MPCLIVLLALLAPRIALFLLWLFTDYLAQVFESTLWPVLGFLFLPTATLAYAFGMRTEGRIHGLYLGLVILGALIDVGAFSGGSRARRARA